MNQSINLIAFGTFGSPSGFRQTFFVGNNELAQYIKTFDLKTDAIKLFPKSKLYSIRKEYVNSLNTIAYSIYTFAKEQNSDRSGTFIGSSILFTNKIASENNTISRLNEFHTNLIDKNVVNDIINVNHSEKLSVRQPKDFDKLEFTLREISDLNFTQTTNKNLVVYSSTSLDKLQILLSKSIDLLNVFDTIYFTDSPEIAEFVHLKGIFQLVKIDGFEQEIQKLQEERKQRTESSINEFENEKISLETDEKKLLETYKYQIEQNEKLHQENSRKIIESRNDLIEISQKYDGYSKQIDKSINDLRSGRKLDAVRQLHNENKRIFIDSINEQKQPHFINRISKHNVRTELKQKMQPSHSSPYEEDSTSLERIKRRNSEPKLDIFKLLTFILFVIWIGTLAFFLFFNNTEASIEAVQPQVNQTAPVESTKNEPTPVKELNPKTNAELSENDYKIVAKKIKKDMPVKDIVQIIFDANPTDIKSNYSLQIEEYSKKIVELNKDCFKVDSGKFFLSKDTLRHIPYFKKSE